MKLKALAIPAAALAGAATMAILPGTGAVAQDQDTYRELENFLTVFERIRANYVEEVDDHELITIIEGEGSSQGTTRHITEWLAEHHPDVEPEVHHGGQPLYPYLFGIE